MGLRFVICVYGQIPRHAATCSFPTMGLVWACSKAVWGSELLSGLVTMGRSEIGLSGAHTMDSKALSHLPHRNEKSSLKLSQSECWLRRGDPSSRLMVFIQAALSSEEVAGAKVCKDARSCLNAHVTSLTVKALVARFSHCTTVKGAQEFESTFPSLTSP